MTMPDTPLTVEQILARLRGMLGRANKRDRKALDAAMAAIFELATLLHVERSRTAGVTVVDEVGVPLTAEIIEDLLTRRRRERAAALGTPPRHTRADEIAGEGEPVRFKGLDTGLRLAGCSERCVQHDECDSPCTLPAGHDPIAQPHECEFARVVA
jgi:hypothetical protein